MEETLTLEQSPAIRNTDSWTVLSNGRNTDSWAVPTIKETLTLEQSPQWKRHWLLNCLQQWKKHDSWTVPSNGRNTDSWAVPTIKETLILEQSPAMEEIRTLEPSPTIRNTYPWAVPSNKKHCLEQPPHTKQKQTQTQMCSTCPHCSWSNVLRLSTLQLVKLFWVNLISETRF